MLNLLDHNKVALLVIDPQNAFVHSEGTLGISGINVEPAKKTIPLIRKLAEAFRAAGAPVFWTLQEHTEIDKRRERKRLPSHTSKRKKVSALANTWDAAFVDEISDLAHSIPENVIRKHRFGAFYETRLNTMLELHGVEAIFVVGATTNACVETSIREAYLRDYDVIAIRDGIAGVRPDWEKTAMEVWSQYLAYLSDSGEVFDWLQQAVQPRTLGFGHVLLKCRDLDVSARFYIDQLGLTRKVDSKPLPDGRPLIVTDQGLGLTEGGTGNQEQMDHFAFEVQDVAGLNENLKENGARFVRELGPGPYGLTIYVNDPDGNIVELYEVQN
ncbi:MAG: isochorismatase family protein [Albidovulum sp.]|nr:isochorismatase family protein [Albidovulum sp.]MDE0530500.1 isochorismatase family protein [Albidovulum sp.]